MAFWNGVIKHQSLGEKVMHCLFTLLACSFLYSLLSIDMLMRVAEFLFQRFLHEKGDWLDEIIGEAETSAPLESS